MNKNHENYKKALDKIQASEELKEKTFKKTMPKPKLKMPIIKKYIAACAVVAICFSIGGIYLQNKKPKKIEVNANKEAVIAQKENNLPRFENMEQLKKVLQENNNVRYLEDTIMTEAATNDSAEAKQERSSADYSKTNIQVEGVDEADIVKTDGQYIYYIAKSKVYIIDGKDLTIKSKIDYENDNKSTFTPAELYINKNKMIVLGIGYDYQEEKENYEEDDMVMYDVVRYHTNASTKAIVYDIAKKEEPKKEREVSIDGYYNTSRMIEDNIYFIASKSVYYYDIEELSENEILPKVGDSANTERIIECTDIAYFKGTDNNSFMTVAGFNINNTDEVKTESFFGASDTVYSSQKNLYITQTEYKYTFGNEKTTNTIYKFNLENSNINLQCQTEIKGNLNDQFSMDEYEGNLRIATTIGYDEKAQNQLYILDENLEEIGSINNMAKGEKIYSVRFVGKIGYIVTFEQIDPLFVIDLSDPKNPQIKGELKIPGYSSYLHPYDETHIIGIGYNTKSNGHGGVTNYNMKMSMFDVSDLENPKEMFNIDIGNGYTSSEITSNHKALFYNSKENLIGIPVNYKENGEYTDKFEIFKIDLEKGFEKYGQLKEVDDDYLNVNRAIYIDQNIYMLSSEKVVKYNLKTLEEEKKLDLEE